MKKTQLLRTANVFLSHSYFNFPAAWQTPGALFSLGSLEHLLPLAPTSPQLPPFVPFCRLFSQWSQEFPRGSV